MKQAIGVDFFSEVKMISQLAKKDDALYFVISQANVDKNCYEKDIYRLKNGEVKQLTRYKDVGSFELHENGLRFNKVTDGKSKWEKKTTIYELPFDGGESMPVLELPYLVTNIKYLDDSRFYFTASMNLKVQRLLDSGMTSKEVSDKMDKDLAECREFVEVPFWSNGVGDVSENRSVLFYYDHGSISQITKLDQKATIKELIDNKLFYGIVEYTNGLQNTYDTLYSINENQIVKEHTLFDVKTYHGGLTKINENEILVSAGLHEKHGNNENGRFFIYNLETELTKEIFSGDPYHAGNSVGSDIKMGNKMSSPIIDQDGFYVISTVEDHAPLMKVNFDGTYSFVTKGLEMVQEVIESDHGFDIICMTENHANEIYHLTKEGTLVQLTSLNTGLEEKYHYFKPESFYFTNENGYNIKGFVILPEDTSKKVPCIFDIHGGPKTAFGPHFFHEMQWFAANGYAVIFTNPTGSDGMGNDFFDINGKYGTVDYRDLMTFVDEVLKRYDCIDENRLGVTGGSYGGFMTNWIIGHTNRFKAAVSQRSIANWMIFENTSDIGYTFGPDQQQANQWDNVEKVWEHSPIKYANKVTTPTLFIHSDQDTRCWMGEGISMFYALKRFGVDSKLCLFKGENHELSRSGKPQNRIRRLTELLGWMDKYLKD